MSTPAAVATGGAAGFSCLHLGVVTYLAPVHSLDEPSRVAELREVMAGCRERGEFKVVVDLTNAPLLSSGALEALSESHEALVRLGGYLRLANVASALVDALRVTRLHGYLAIAGDHETDPPPDPQPPLPSGRLGDALVARGLVDEATVEVAIEAQRATGQRLGRILVDRGLVAEADLLAVLAERLELPFVHLRTGVYDPEVVRTLAPAVAKRLRVAPLFRIRDVIYLATADPQAVPELDTVRDLTGAGVQPVLACAAEILEVIASAHSEAVTLGGLIGDLDVDERIEVVEQHDFGAESAIDDMAAESPVIKLVNGLIQRAVQDGASDIHIEPSRARTRVRMRIDGVLYTVMEPPREVHPALVSRLKVMANLDIAERRLPQDGRLQVLTQGRRIDLRFSSLPGIFGEKVVLRVLDKGRSLTDLDELGMSSEHLAEFKSLLARSNGLLLVTGPTGSGKTTTLYAAINHLASAEKSIVTIEDPVEYQFDDINQNQVREGIGLGFARILKHVLRQDPDIVMVGEIREHETAQIAVQAALTGHLVLSTLHTNDSSGAITRLLDMGVEPYLLSSALIGVMAQRLVRAVCPGCQTSYVAPADALVAFGRDSADNVRLVRGRGCPACHDSGYRGRFPVHELLACDTATQRVMLANPSREILQAHIHERGIKTLADAGLARALAGATTLEEVGRVING